LICLPRISVRVLSSMPPSSATKHLATPACRSAEMPWQHRTLQLLQLLALLQAEAEAADWAAADTPGGGAPGASAAPAVGRGAAEAAAIASEFEAAARALLALLRSKQLEDARRAPHLRQLLLRLSFGAPGAGGSDP